MKSKLKFVPLLALLACSAIATAADVKVMSGNFAADITGVRDTRPATSRKAASTIWQATWGNAGSTMWPIKFSPPPGERVVIHSIRGDIVAWSRTSYAGAQDKFGVLAAFQVRRQNTGGAGLCDWCDVSTLLYAQTAAASSSIAQRRFSIRFKAPQELPERTLYVKTAAWLSDIPGPVHIEVTYTVEFEFVALSAEAR